MYTSVMRTLTQPPRRAPRIAARLRSPPAAATRRGIARIWSASAPHQPGVVARAHGRAVGVEEAQAHVADCTLRPQLDRVLRRRHIPRLAQQGRGLQAPDAHERDRDRRQEHHDPPDRRVLHELLRRGRRPEDRRGGEEDRLGARRPGQQVDEAGRLDLDPGVAHPPKSWTTRVATQVRKAGNCSIAASQVADQEDRPMTSPPVSVVSR